MLRLGERIKNRRESLNIQINNLANSIGVTPSLISQIERAKAFPSIITLKKIADSLQTTVGALVGENETYSLNPLVEFSDKKVVQTNEQGATLYLLSNHDQQKLMEPYLFIFPCESSSENLTNFLPGQSFYYVLDGRLSIKMDFQDYHLKRGDSFYFNSGHKHTITNIGKTVAMLLWISTNPIL
ncbi:MAG: cupin domain-containing protein [Candidatus Methanofastidiosum sp.]|nr:cupin domain-containing protein [Methanofastidiosum sp.]